ncbi:MAG: hypothetical protein WDM94_08515 [Bauldia sp.]
MFKSWIALAALSAESQQVMWLRSFKLAAGGAAAQTEANLMVSEKIAAATDAALRLSRGASPDSIVRAYRRKVRANAKRLTK